jgi:hypothetical protein
MRSAPVFSIPWVALLLGAAAAFIAVTQPKAREPFPVFEPSSGICRGSEKTESQ